MKLWAKLVTRDILIVLLVIGAFCLVLVTTNKARATTLLCGAISPQNYSATGGRILDKKL
jgi:hypothetical protein